jgi:hypothetical protein
MVALFLALFLALFQDVSDLGQPGIPDGRPTHCQNGTAKHEKLQRLWRMLHLILDNVSNGFRKIHKCKMCRTKTI